MLRNLSQLVSVGLISSTLIGLGMPIANASTTVNYKSPCKYIDTTGRLRANQTCNVNFGTISAKGGARYIVTFPNGAEITIVQTADGQTTTNRIPSSLAIAGGNIVDATEEGEIFIFKSNNGR